MILGNDFPLNLSCKSQNIHKDVIMKNTVKKGLALVGLVGLGAVNANAAVTMPTPSYTDIEAAAAVGFGIAITVALLMRAKSFFR